MKRPIPERRSLPVIAAVALHAGLPLLAFLAPPGLAPAVTVRLETIDVSIEDRAVVRVEPDRERGAAPAAPGEAETPSSEALRSRTRRREAGVVRSDDPSPDPGAPDVPIDPGATEAPAPAQPEWDAPPDDGRDALAPGFGGTPIWAVPGAVTAPQQRRAAPTRPDAPRSVDPDVAGKVLRAEQAARDKSIGIDLPAAGTVAAAIAEAARLTDTPHQGRATIAVRLGPDGEVLGVGVLRSTSGAGSWERAARLAQSRLASKRLVMTGAYAGGATVVVDVSSRVQLPAGDGVGPSGIKPGPAPGTVGGGVAFDLSNVGAHATRVVTTSFRVVASR